MFYLVVSCPIILSFTEKLNFGWMEPTKFISWLPGEFSTLAFGKDGLPRGVTSYALGTLASLPPRPCSVPGMHHLPGKPKPPNISRFPLGVLSPLTP